MEQPQSGLRVDPVDGTGEGVLRASTETVLAIGVPSPAVEQGRLQALRYDLNREVYTMEQARALIARCRAALSVEAPSSKKEQP